MVISVIIGKHFNRYIIAFIFSQLSTATPDTHVLSKFQEPPVNFPYRAGLKYNQKISFVYNYLCIFWMS